MISLMRVIVFRAALSTALVSCNEKRTTYYENGNEKSVEELKDGILNGRYMFFYDDGQLAAEVTNLNGVHHGEEIMYFENGTVQERKTWKNGLLNGPKKVFDQDGRVTAIFNYKDDVQVGNETFFYPNGRVSHLQTYDSVGNLVYKMKWDSANHKVYSRAVPIVKVSRDTVRVYEECLVSVSFGYPLTGAINIEFEAIKSKISQAFDLIKIRFTIPFCLRSILSNPKSRNSSFRRGIDLIREILFLRMEVDKWSKLWL